MPVIHTDATHYSSNFLFVQKMRGRKLTGAMASFDRGNCLVSVVIPSANIRSPACPLQQRCCVRCPVSSIPKLIQYRFASDSPSRPNSPSYTSRLCRNPVTHVCDEGRSMDIELRRRRAVTVSARHSSMSLAE